MNDSQMPANNGNDTMKKTFKEMAIQACWIVVGAGMLLLAVVMASSLTNEMVAGRTNSNVVVKPASQ